MKDIFDRQAMLDEVEGDEDLLEEVLQIFLEHTPKQLKELRRAVEAGDALQVQEQAHSLKGAAASIKAETMRAAALEMELAGRNRALEGAGALLEDLAREFERLKDALGG